MAAPGAGTGPGASPGLEAALQKLALRRKKVLSAEEMELYELVQAAGGSMDPDVIMLGLLKLNVAPLDVFQTLKSMCAGQRLPSESQAPAAVSLPTSSAPERRGQRWARGPLIPESPEAEKGSVDSREIRPQASSPSLQPSSPALAPSGSHGARDSSPEHPPQRLPHAAAELPDLAELLCLAADW
uniref:Mitotic spindle organizing protein 2B n=1 Tax=Equus asinus TaxID=9793 RepID=A0A9L0J290_EQUAS